MILLFTEIVFKMLTNILYNDIKVALHNFVFKSHTIYS